MCNDNYKATAEATVKATIKNGQVIKAVTKAVGVSSVSLEKANKKAYKKAKKYAIHDLKKQVHLLNKIILKENENNCFSNLIAKPNFVLNDAVHPLAKPMAVGSPSYGYVPSQIKSIYNVKPISNIGSARKVSITIIIAYNHPNLQKDFNKFCSLNGLPPYTLNQINLGSTTNTKLDWAQEECLDVQWAYAMNPNANIRVVKAKSASFSDLFAAIQYANNSSNGITDIISMSWGANEFGASQSTYDKIYFANNSICYLAATGDSNSVSWPATSPNVLACGGTTLNSNIPNFSSRFSETTWSAAGCGYSTVYSKPDYQKSVSNLKSYSKRCIPDLSGISNPSSGVQVVYNGNLYIFGGTSVSTPVNAGMLSIAIQNRLNNRKQSITTYYKGGTRQTNLLQNILYSTYGSNGSNPTYSNNFYDVKAGRDGKYTSGGGFDMPTGLGVQNCDNLTKTILASQ